MLSQYWPLMSALDEGGADLTERCAAVRGNDPQRTSALILEKGGGPWSGWDLARSGEGDVRWRLVGHLAYP